MVGVEVGEHEQRHAGHAEPAQAAVDEPRVGTRVDDDRAARSRPQHERVALAHVAGGEHPARLAASPGVGGPATVTTTSTRQAAAPDTRCRSTGGPAPSTRAVTTTQERQRPGRGPPVEGGARQRGRRARRPRRSRRRTRPPSCRPRGRPRAGPSPTTPPSRPSTVAGPTTGATTRLAATATRLTWPESAATSGRAGELRGRRHRDRLRQPARQPPGERVAPGRRQQQDPGGREHGQREPRRGRQAGVDEQQPDDRDAEAPDPPVPAAVTEPDQRDRPHRGGPQHARLGAGQQHEPDDPGRPDDGQPATAHADPARHHEQEADDQGQVGARDRGQVRQPGGPEVGAQRLGHRGVVAVHQRRHQRTLALGGGAPRTPGSTHAAPRGPPGSARVVDPRGRTARRDQGRHLPDGSDPRRAPAAR